MDNGVGLNPLQPQADISDESMSRKRIGANIDLTLPRLAWLLLPFDWRKTRDQREQSTTCWIFFILPPNVGQGYVASYLPEFVETYSCCGPLVLAPASSSCAHEGVLQTIRKTLIEHRIVKYDHQHRVSHCDARSEIHFVCKV